jgi:hypothetical protein
MNVDRILFFLIISWTNDIGVVIILDLTLSFSCSLSLSLSPSLPLSLSLSQKERMRRVSPQCDTLVCHSLSIVYSSFARAHTPFII